MAVTLEQKGDFKKLTSWLERTKTVFKVSMLDKYGRAGVKALEEATPKDTGLTSKSWSYEIINKDGVATIEFHNDNVSEWANVAILIQYGHATRNGGYVQGIDYINPALAPIFNELAEKAWEEVKKT